MKPRIAIIGGGPAAVLLAAKLNTEKFNVTLFEKNQALGRKFLVAGNGGFNLTHSDDLEILVGRYRPNYFLKSAINNFSNKDLIIWLSELGIETYTGSSKRIFPLKGTRPIQVLELILEKIKNNGVDITTNYKWIGFADDNTLIFDNKSTIVKVNADIVVFALGGASWKVTGSDGTWTDYFISKNILCNAFEASNCGYATLWPDNVIEDLQGQALKNCKFKCGDSFHLGEAVITKFGIEGSGVYPLGFEVRYQLKEHSTAKIFIDLKPEFTEDEIFEKISARNKKPLTQFLEKELNLGKTKTSLLKSLCTKEEFTNDKVLSKIIKNLEILITGLAPIDEAISTVGGIALSEVDEHYQLKKLPKHYVIGEMLDWDAPTGGYLLQACFSMGNNLAHHLNKN